MHRMTNTQLTTTHIDERVRADRHPQTSHTHAEEPCRHAWATTALRGRLPAQMAWNTQVGRQASADGSGKPRAYYRAKKNCPAVDFPSNLLEREDPVFRANDNYCEKWLEFRRRDSAGAGYYPFVQHRIPPPAQGQAFGVLGKRAKLLIEEYDDNGLH